MWQLELGKKTTGNILRLHRLTLVDDKLCRVKLGVGEKGTYLFFFF